MPRPFRPLILALIIVVVPALAIAAWLAWAGDAFRSIDYRDAGRCEGVALAGPVQDIAVDRERGVAYLAMLDGVSGRGTVMLLDLNLAQPAPRAAMSRDPRDFRPSGIDLEVRSGEPARLFAVSGAAPGVPSVEISERDANGAFVPQRSMHDPLFDHARFVAAANAETFYLAVHRSPKSAFTQKLDVLRRSGDDSLFWYDGKAIEVARDLAWISGIAWSADRTHLYVAELLARSVRVYRRDDSNGALSLERTIALGEPPGGLAVDAQGVLWITAHPRLSQYLALSAGSRDRTPTLVLRYDPRQPDAKPQPVLADDGARLSAGGSIARWRDQLLIGSPFDDKVLICRIAP